MCGLMALAGILSAPPTRRMTHQRLTGRDDGPARFQAWRQIALTLVPSSESKMTKNSPASQLKLPHLQTEIGPAHLLHFRYTRLEVHRPLRQPSRIPFRMLKPNLTKLAIDSRKAVVVTKPRFPS